MKTDSKAKQAVKSVRIAQRKHFDQAVFCRQHNMKLQEMLHIEMEKELGDIAMKLEDILNTGYVGINK